MTTVLHVVEAFSTGIIQSIRTICRALEGAVAFHVLHGQRPETPNDVQAVFPASVGFTPWTAAQRSIHPKRDLDAIRQLRATVAAVRPDVIHAHSSKAGALARLAYFRGHLPILYSPRGYSFLQRDKSATGRATFWLMERLLGTLPHITVGCGLGEYTLARNLTRHALHIPNMVDFTDFQSAASLRPDSQAPLRIAMVGGIRPQKNFPLFCRIANLCHEMPWHFLWIGDGTIPADTSVPSNVEITGWLPRPDVLCAMAGCHLYLQTSLWEGLPIALLEGMTLGLAVLAHPAVGNTELVIEGGNGFLCSDANAFAHRLAQLDGNREMLAKMGAQSRHLVAQNHAVSQAAQRWLSLYQYYERYFHHG